MFIAQVLPLCNFSDLLFDRIYLCISSIHQIETIPMFKIPEISNNYAICLRECARILHLSLRHQRSRLRVVLPPPRHEPHIFYADFLRKLHSHLMLVIMRCPHSFPFGPHLPSAPPSHHNNPQPHYNMYNQSHIVESWYEGRQVNQFHPQPSVVRNTQNDKIHLTSVGPGIIY